MTVVVNWNLINSQASFVNTNVTFINVTFQLFTPRFCVAEA